MRTSYAIDWRRCLSRLRSPRYLPPCRLTNPLDIGHTHHHGIGPLVVIVQALRAHDREMKPAVILRPACLGIDPRFVLKHLTRLAQYFNLSPLCGTYVGQRDHLAFALGLRFADDDGVDRVALLGARVPDIVVEGERLTDDRQRTDVIDGFVVGEEPERQLHHAVGLLDG